MVNMKAAAAELKAAGADFPVQIADFATWMASEQKRIYSLCLRMLRNDHDADSATQDAFLKAFRSLERAPELVVEEPAKWLTRIAVNTCLDRLRSRRWLFWSRRSPAAEETAVLERARANNRSAEDQLAALCGVGPVDGHPNECADCRQRQEFMRRRQDELRLAGANMSEAFFASQRRAILARTEGRPRSAGLQLVPWLAAVVLLLAIVI